MIPRAGGPRSALLVMTPRRAALNAQVEAAPASMRNSPRLARPTSKRLHNLAVPRLGRAWTSSAKTPELTKYTCKTTAAVAKAPDVMKRYRGKLQQGQKMVNKMMDLDSIKNKLSKREEPSSSSSTFIRQSSGRRSGSGTNKENTERNVASDIEKGKKKENKLKVKVMMLWTPCLKIIALEHEFQAKIPKNQEKKLRKTAKKALYLLRNEEGIKVSFDHHIIRILI